MFDNVDRILYEDEQAMDYLPVPRAPWRHFVRQDPFMSMNDREFRINFRLKKDSVLNLNNVLSPYLKEDGRGHALTPLQMILLTLSSLAGDEFQRTSARLLRCDQATVSRATDKVLNALVCIKPLYVRLPTREEAQKSADEIRERFLLENFAYGIDGVHMLFREQPRNIEPVILPDGTFVEVDPREFRNWNYIFL